MYIHRNPDTYVSCVCALRPASLYTTAADIFFSFKIDIYAPGAASMSKKRVLSTLQLQSARDLEALDFGVRELLQTYPNVPCNALLTAGYALFKRDCLTQLDTDAASRVSGSKTAYPLGAGFSLHLHNKQVLFCFTPRFFDLPEKE